jgi:succinate dehydrogenase / fumarate reductase, iron-sulfur subunit
MAQATFRIWRGDANGGALHDYTAEVGEGMVVLDCVHQIQATQAPDLACRWNCKAGKCGSCSAEINGKPRLLCMTRMDDERFVTPGEPVVVEPIKAFPLVRDLVPDVSWNYKVNKLIPPFKPRPPDDPDGTWRMAQEEVDRIQEFRKCIECFLCQDVCHVLRDHDKKEGPRMFGGPRFMIRVASLEMHPLDTGDRLALLKDDLNIGLCNITKCCTEVCPEHIHITDNGIIPLKERVVDEYYDPVMWVVRKLFGGEREKDRVPLPMAPAAQPQPTATGQK